LAQSRHQRVETLLVNRLVTFGGPSQEAIFFFEQLIELLKASFGGSDLCLIQCLWRRIFFAAVGQSVVAVI
jgi:hypothetical protein